LVSCARATRGLRRPSVDARSGRPSRPPSREEKIRQASLEGSIKWMTVARCAQERATSATPLNRSMANRKALAARGGWTPLIPSDRQLHGRGHARRATRAPSSGHASGGPQAAHTPGQARSSSTCSPHGHCGVGFLADQAGARRPPIFVAWEAHGSGAWTRSCRPPRR
jgi:hypothetical protein